MVGLRKASAYSKMKVVPFTRTSKKKNRAYIKVIPPQKIAKFSMGSESLYAKGKFPYTLTVVADANAQIRHNSLEACRQYISKMLDEELPGQYLFRVVPYPHHIQRENKMLTGAGADRMQTGMSLSFGACIGKAALVKPGSKIFFAALTNEKHTQFLRGVIDEIRSKLPCKIRVLYTKPKAQVSL